MIKYLAAITLGAILSVASANAQGYHWVNPYYDHNGTFYRGHPKNPTKNGFITKPDTYWYHTRGREKTSGAEGFSNA